MTTQNGDSSKPAPQQRNSGFDKRAEALRENLRKRKQQGRARDDSRQPEKEI